VRVNAAVVEPASMSSESSIRNEERL